MVFGEILAKSGQFTNHRFKPQTPIVFPHILGHLRFVKPIWNTLYINHTYLDDKNQMQAQAIITKMLWLYKGHLWWAYTASQVVWLLYWLEMAWQVFDSIVRSCCYIHQKCFKLAFVTRNCRCRAERQLTYIKIFPLSKSLIANITNHSSTLSSSLQT